MPADFRFRRAALIALVAVFAMPAVRADTTSNASGVSDAQAADFLGRLQAAVKADDAAGVAALAAFPLQVNQGGRHRRIANAAALASGYATIVTASVKQAVLAQQPGGLFHNGQGVMIGNGEAWFGAVCDDATCQASKVRLISVNPAGN